ncbi:class I SAM-dependent methyltransferase [Marinobacter sp. chi1]|uniref:Class I SAM-dependent methyltransferase n=1 Tax=Marinobacter suaedae TaxID=3057675 RepID=A0ABT8W3N5_9GAMM|nr:class I SAM-dependent methyltransferase [Marinobacter sp. chi1]MDO3722860.1 class I SAM-dependent methyltransferase [Marinobacter sp. chi1]
MVSRCPVCQQAELSAFQTIRQYTYLRCPVCEATVMAEGCRLSADEERGIYDCHENDPADPGYRRFLSKLLDPLLAELEPGMRGLDFGCGPGPALADMLTAAGMSMSLYDPFFYPDTGALSDTYDFITCTEVVEHLHQPARVFRQLDRLMKPGSWLGVMTCFQTDDDRFANWHYRRDPTHVVFFREKTLGIIAEQRGWQLSIPRKDVALFRKPLTRL